MDCVCSVKKIKKLCGEEKYAPGVYPRLHITCCDEVLTIPAPAAGTLTVSANITMRAAVVGPPAVAAGKFYDWEFEFKAATYESEKDENGLWNTTLKVMLTKLTAEKSYILSRMNGPSHIVLFEDMNQEGRRIIGDTLNGCEVKVKEMASPKNGYEVSITWQSADAPLWYTGTVTV